MVIRRLHTFENRQQGAAMHPLGQRNIRQFQESRCHIDEFHQSIAAQSCLKAPRQAHDQRHAHHSLVKSAAGPGQSVVTRYLTVIAHENNQGILTLTGFFEQFQDAIVLVGPTEAIIPLLDEMRSLVTEQGGCELDENEVHFARIDQRIPSIPDEIGPNDLPQEGFLEKKAVSFDKGCFLGQEVMARLRSLGGVQRSLWVIKPMKTGLSAPSELFVEGRPAGLLKTRYSKGDKEIGAAMLRIKYVQTAIMNGISTEPNEKPSIVLLHEFNF